MRYSVSKNSVTLKTRLGVVHGHWKWCQLIDHIQLYVVYQLYVRNYKYSSTWYRFWVTWRWMILWPWNLGERSLKVIRTGTIRKLGCDFLFAFHGNYGSILHHLRDKARYWSKIVICSYPLHSTPQWGGSPSEYCHPVWFGTQYRRVTDGRIDGRTDILPRHSPSNAYASRGNNAVLYVTLLWALHIVIQVAMLSQWGRAMLRVCQ